MGLAIILWIGFAILIGVMASNYGRSIVGYAILSLLLSPLLALIILLVVGKSQEKKEEEIQQEEEWRAKYRKD